MVSNMTGQLTEIVVVVFAIGLAIWLVRQLRFQSTKNPQGPGDGGGIPDDGVHHHGGWGDHSGGGRGHGGDGGGDGGH